MTTTSSQRAASLENAELSSAPVRLGTSPVQRAPAHSRPVSTTRPVSSRSDRETLNGGHWGGEMEDVFGSRRKRQIRWTAAALAVAGISAAVFFATIRSSLEDDLQFQVAEGPWRASGHVEAPEAPEVLEFTDGSRLTLAPSSSLRVRATDADGAEVV